MQVLRASRAKERVQLFIVDIDYQEAISRSFLKGLIEIPDPHIVPVELQIVSYEEPIDSSVALCDFEAFGLMPVSILELLGAHKVRTKMPCEQVLGVTKMLGTLDVVWSSTTGMRRVFYVNSFGFSETRSVHDRWPRNTWFVAVHASCMKHYPLIAKARGLTAELFALQ